MKKFREQNVECRMWEGEAGSIPDTIWLVETLEGEEFVELGKIEVKGEDVRRQMLEHCSIKDYEPGDIAERMAAEGHDIREQDMVKHSRYVPICLEYDIGNMTYVLPPINFKVFGPRLQSMKKADL
jgi:hypothetical protein